MVGKANSFLLLCWHFTFDRSQRKYHWIFICFWIFIYVAAKAKKKHHKCSSLSDRNALHTAPVSTLFALDQSCCIICGTSKQNDMSGYSTIAYAQVQVPRKSCSTFYCRIWMGSSFLIPSQRYYCMLVFVCLFSIPHHLRHPYLNNTTPSSTQCVENIQLGSSEKTSGVFFFSFSFFDHSAQQV